MVNKNLVKQANQAENQVVNPQNTSDHYHHIALQHRDIIKQVIYGCFKQYNPNLIKAEYEDMYSEGYLSLYKAAKTYDAEQKASFNTYAYKLIHQGLQNYLKMVVKRNGRYIPYDEEEMEAYANTMKQDDSTELNMNIQKIMEDYMDERERTIFANKTGIGLQEKAMNTEELAQLYHLTTQHVNRIKRSAIDKVRYLLATA